MSVIAASKERKRAVVIQGEDDKSPKDDSSQL
jgi:hypothetical protein